MNKKPGKPAPEDSRKADRGVDSDHSADENVSKNNLRPAREGPENLRQRAEWFRRRAGDDK
jgi:hypothetical protein